MKRFILLLAAGLLAACGESPTQTFEEHADLRPAMSVQGVSQTAAGSGAFEFGGALRTFSFSAQVAMDGSARGQFQLYSRSSGARVTGTLTCATIFGNIGWFGGVITTKGPFEGREANFTAFDEGAGRKGFADGISLLLVGAPGNQVAQPYCDNTPFDRGFFLTDGITISAPGNASFTTTFSIPIQLDVLIPCALGGAGEIARLEGPLQLLFHFTEDQAGGFLFRSQSNPQGVSGYGLTSGDQYQGTGMGGAVDHFSINGFPANFTFVDNFRIIGQGSGNNLTIHGNFHVTVNANGDVTVVADNFSASCG